MSQDFFTEITNYGLELINEHILSGEPFIADDWYIAIGTGNLIPSNTTTSLVNSILDKTSDDYPGIIIGYDATIGRYAEIQIPYALQGNVITELGLFDGDDNLILCANTQIDFTKSFEEGLYKTVKARLSLIAIPESISIDINPSSDFMTESQINALIADYQPLNEKGGASGYCELDEDSNVPASRLTKTIGTLASLTTTAKTTIVSAINELVSKVNSIFSRIQHGSCSTLSATAEKTVTAAGFTYVNGAQLCVQFSNTNTALVPTINANSLGAKPIYTKSGNEINGTNYKAFFPADCKILFTYDDSLGSNGGFYFENTSVKSYTNGTSGYEIKADGKKSQWGYTATSQTITLLVAFIYADYSILFGLKNTDSALGMKWHNKTVSSFDITHVWNVYTGEYTSYGFWKVEGY